MNNKNIHTHDRSLNLLNSRDLISAIRFEAEYALIDHLPYYYSGQKKRRLVNDINLLSAVEQREIVLNVFISKN